MGITPTSVLGWGLDDVVPQDPRVNWDNLWEFKTDKYFEYLQSEIEKEEGLDAREQDGYLQLEYRHFRRLYETEKFLDFIKESVENIALEGTSSEIRNIKYNVCRTIDPVAYSDEGGLSNVLVITPPSEVDWHRYADDFDYAYAQIDYYENGVDFVTPKVNVLRSNPWPYDVFWMDDRTGQKFQHGNLYEWLRAVKNTSYPLGDDTKETLTQELLGMSYEDTQHIVPGVPGAVKRVGSFLNLFTENVYKDMKPMLYTYWS